LQNQEKRLTISERALLYKSISATGFVSKEGQSKNLLVSGQVPEGSWTSPEGPITYKGGGCLKEVLPHMGASWMTTTLVDQISLTSCYMNI